MNFNFCGAMSYKFNLVARHKIAPEQCIHGFTEISSRQQAGLALKILSQRCTRRTAEIPPRQYAQRSMWQTAAARAAKHKKFIVTHATNGKNSVKMSLIMRYENFTTSAHTANRNIMCNKLRNSTATICAASYGNSAAKMHAVKHAASCRNFIEIARMTSHQIPTENHKIIAESCKILIERHKIPAERGAAR